MDATLETRKFLKTSGIHDFEEQKKGQDHKQIISTTLVAGDRIEETKTSLYRPETKNGDPRICVYNLKRHTNAGDLLALTKSPTGLTIINCSKTNLDRLLSLQTQQSIDNSDKIQETRSNYLDTIKNRQLIIPELLHSGEFLELLSKLKEISKQGFIESMRPGDTGVGFTLETLLGIQANSSQSPDYKGIEIKSSRQRTEKAGQTTVFSQVPDWSISTLKGSKYLLNKHGRYNEKKKRRQLFHEISATTYNSYGLKLEIDHAHGLLHQVFISGDTKETDVSWAISKLKERLLEKHKETAWVSAKTKNTGSREEFWYNRLKHTAKVDAEALPTLLEAGAITVHYLIKETPTGGAKDQGYLFKTSHKNLDLLFSEIEEIDL